MTVPVLQSRVLYGLKTDVAGNAHYITDTDILYPVGGALAIHNFSQRRQRLLRLPDKRQINIIAVTPNKKYVAVCEIGEKPTINIYDLNTLRRKKSLGIPYDAPGVTKFNCVSFSHDSRCLAAVTSEPDQTMLFYAWEKGKVESSMKIPVNQSNPSSKVNQVACNPGDTGVMALGGPYVFKFLTVSETVWRPYGFSKADNILIISMTWLNTDRLFAGTRDGRMLYLENGDLKNIYKMAETLTMNLKIREEYVVQTSVTSLAVDANNDEYWENDVRSLVAFQRGFAYGQGHGKIFLFEREGQHKYTRRNIFVVPERITKKSNDRLYRINSISSNPSYDGLIVTTGWSQLYCAKLWGPESLANVDSQPLRIMGQNLHHGGISGLSLCAWKSVFMTCGEIDRSVRMWDYETENLIMTKQYQQDICSVALHPIGLFCLVGFSDKLRFMSILMDDLTTIQEIPVRNCRTVSFSQGGHMFAAVNGNIIQIYTTIGFSNRHMLKGHTGKIKDLAWSQNDAKIVSIGSDGAIYEWDTANGHRSSEIIIKGINLYGVAMNSDSTAIYCISSDNKLREIREKSVNREFSLNDLEMRVMTMGKDDFGIFVGSPGGMISFVKYPLQEPLEIVEFHLHRDDITCMSLSFDERILVSTANDGTMCLWRVTKFEGITIGRDGDAIRTNEILIGQGDLEDKVRKIEELSLRMRELETEQAYKIRQTEVQHNDKVRDIHQGYCEAIEELREKIDKLNEERTNEINNINVDIGRMKKSHEKELQMMESNYDAKLINEYDKYRAFEERNNEMRQSYEERIEEMTIEKTKEFELLTKKYESQLYSKNLQLEEIHEEISHLAMVHEKLKEQIEDDADREIVDLRANYESLLNDERQTIIKLKGESGVLRNKYFATRKEIEDLKRQAANFQSDNKQSQKNIQGLERDVVDLKKEITERDVTIQDKEKRIYELKRDNQELEKFKFVLNYKIRELKSQIEPRDQEIKDLKEKIRDMEVELINLHKTNVSLELQLQELREKLGGSRKSNDQEISRNRSLRLLLRKIRIDISNVAESLQDPRALKNAVMKIHHRYSAEEEFARIKADDFNAHCEFSKQRDHLERTVDTLRKQVFNETSGEDKRETDKIMNENVFLLVELNALRDELKKACKHINDMESLLGVSVNDNLGPREARKKLSDACHGKEELERDYRTKMLECEKIIAILQDDVKRLLGDESRKSELT